MILLDVVTPASSVSLGSGDTGLFTVAFIIFAICCIPFLGRHG